MSKLQIQVGFCINSYNSATFTNFLCITSRTQDLGESCHLLDRDMRRNTCKSSCKIAVMIMQLNQNWDISTNIERSL